MNWSDYSRFVGDVFGAPLAIEGLLAFFLESTFLGLWIFGWDRLPAGLHLACIWLVHVGTLLSAYFILAANSWMQHPVGYRYNPDTGRAELTDFCGGADQQGAAGDVPAHVARGVPDRRRVRARDRRLAADRGTATPDADRTLYRTAVRVGAGRGAGRRARRRGHRRPAGQGDDRGAADEDGRRRGALRHRAAGRRSRSSPSAPWTARRSSSRSRCPGLLSFLATGSFDGRGRGHQRAARRSTSRPTARTRARRTTPPAATCRSSR